MLVGYKLLDSSNTEIQTWGGVYGQTPSVPPRIILPNGDIVEAPIVGSTYGDYSLIEWDMDAPSPSTDPNDYPLQPYQFQAALKINGLTDLLSNAITTTANTMEAIVISSKLEYSTIYLRSDPLFDQIGGLINLTSEQIDTIWMQAKDL